MGNAHSYTTMVQVEDTNRSISIYTVSRATVEGFNKNRSEGSNEAKIVTTGFRNEFDGIPVIQRDTGKTVTRQMDSYYVAGTYPVIETAMIRRQEGFICLCNYSGPASDGWTGDDKKLLIEEFTKAVSTYTEKEVEVCTCCIGN